MQCTSDFIKGLSGGPVYVDINVGIFLSSFYPGGSLVQTLTAALAQTEQEKLAIETAWWAVGVVVTPL